MRIPLSVLCIIVSINCCAQNPCRGVEFVYDNDSNKYATIALGTQCWIQENLKTMHTCTGEEIPEFNPDAIDSISFFFPDPDDRYSELVQEYGYKYTWGAAQIACPLGWHLPSEKEWDVLFQYVSADSANWCNENPQYIAKALASETGWHLSEAVEYTDCFPAVYPYRNNNSGFCAKPADMIYYDMRFNQLTGETGFSAHFWTSTHSTGNMSCNIHIIADEIYQYDLPCMWGLSVRCMMD